MSRLVHFAVRWPKQVLGVWAVVVVALSVIGMSAEHKLVPTQLLIKGTESAQWHDLRKGHFGESAAVLLEGPASAIDQQGPQLASALMHRPLTTVMSPWSPSPAAHRLRPSPTKALLVVELAVPPGKTIDDVVPPWIAFVRAHVHAPLTPHYTGLTPLAYDMNDAMISSLHKGENLALPVLILVLLLVFRSPIAAAIPLVIAMASVRAGYGVIALLANVKTIDAIALSMASMIGLALGVDYSLLIVSRFRESLDSGLPPRQAATLAANTAGRTAIFAGCVLLTLMIPLYVIAPGSIIPSGAIGAAVVTLLSMVAAIFVTPATCALVGGRVNKFMIGGRGGWGGGAALAGAAVAAGAAAGAGGGRGPRAWRARLAAEGGLIAAVVRWATRRPLRSIALVAPVLAAMALPLLTLKIIPPDPRGLPPGSPGLADYHAVRSAGFGPEVEVLLKSPSGTLVDPYLLPKIAAFEDELRHVKNVSFVVGPGALASRTAMLRRAPGEIRQAERNLASAKHELGDRVAQLHHAKSEIAAERQKVVSGIATGRSLLARGNQLMSGADAGLSQLGQLTDGLSYAHAGASQLLSGARLLQAKARLLAGALGTLRSRIQSVFPQVSSGDHELRDAEAQLNVLRQPAQVTETQLQQAYDTLKTMTVGKTDPQYLAALAHVGIALGAATGRNPVTGANAFPQYQGLDATLRQAAAQASRAGDTLDSAVAEAGQGSNAMIQLADGASRLVNPGLSTLRYGLGQLEQGLGYAHNRLVAASPQIRNELAQGRSLFNQASHLFNSDVSGAMPKFDELQNGVDAGSARLSQIYSQLMHRTGPFHPLRDVATLQAISPNFFRSGYLVVAALNGASFTLRATANAIVDSAGGGDVGRIILLPNVPTNSPQQDAVVDSVRRLAHRFAAQNGLITAVGGSAGELTDYKRSTVAAIPWLIIVALVFTYFLLLPILRSVILPGIAIALNMITVACAFGVLCLLFVKGAPLHAPLGGAGALDVIAVAGVFAIMYALSIDYQVFLLTRMREEYVRTQSNDGAIEFGIARTAKVVTGAAIIMIAVFSSFGLAPFVLIKMFGIGLGTAVLVDATLVRLILLPAVMKLFGEWTWWMPRWLDERLPAIDTEGAEFEHAIHVEHPGAMLVPA
jgi:RND superfamily putative drug exporter